VQLIDYKTGRADTLRKQVRDPTEDTQLAFYAALMTMRDDAPGEPVEAAYLALDGNKGIELIEHPDVERSAALLVEQLGAELDRIRGGAALPALGAGVACDFCAARGLCRRDDWAQTP
jgi:ATP-dependent helicase/nuclease subunit B